MLKGIDPVLGPDLLALLARMGHGDVIAVVDRNYPAHAAGVPVVELAVDLPRALEAVLGLMPVDRFQEHPLRHMLTDDGADGPALADVRAVVDLAEGRAVGALGVDRLAFYPAARSCFCVVRTTEERPYACVMVAKGVV
ncbi:hypothetical protein OEB99_01960 [Actinotalea sp. M2MS4P-6]|uniref:RbsD/FucU family protein n=1 Tax=Actinotalea sp. M2MS4P-6 TaxID=2983762 RepID=UPI0021E4FCC4|nr:RbsD/FucU domain-containing protein [Actinotalea sp. M2MS4P-6]MCV2393062.1 hypothetical protein [Actinotalea sp. M2MS4P-6]